MKRLLAISLCYALTLTLKGTTYYVSADGDDTNTGTSSGQAWATLDQLNIAASEDEFLDGDSILFSCNDTFTGSIGFNLKYYYLGAYGSGNKPVLSGTVPVSGWEVYNGNIWRAAFVTENELRFLFVDGVSQPIGRYPDADWLIFEDGSERTQLTDTDLSLTSNYFAGGKCVIRVRKWIIDAIEIASHTSNQITLTSNATYELEDGSGYFFQNHPNTLNLEGEWSYNEGYIYLYSSTDPNTRNISAPYYTAAATFKYTYGKIDGLSFYGYAHYGLETEWACRDLTITNCDFSYIGVDALKLNYVSPNLNITNNTIQNVFNNGINLLLCDNSYIAGNSIESCGTVRGLGNNGNSTYQGIKINQGINHVISGNSIENIGYCGISFKETPAIQILNNYINNACMLKEDGGGIYTYSQSSGPSYTGHIIRGNTIGNVIGNLEGVTNQNDQLGCGIQLDDNTNDVTIEDNVLFGNSKALYIHNSRNTVVRNNVFIDNMDGIFMYRNNEVDVVGNSITNNIFLSTTDAGIYEVTPYNLHNYFIRIRSGLDLLLETYSNTFNYNQYCTPFYTEEYIAIDCPDDRTGRYNVDQFRSNSIHAENSITGPIQWDAGMGISKEDFVLFDYATHNSKIIALDGYYITPGGNLKFGNITLGAYQSIILFKENSTPIPDISPVGTTNICSAATEQYYFNPSDSYDDYTWSLTPAISGVITPVNDTTISINWSDTYTGEAYLRISACASGVTCNNVSEPLIINIQTNVEADFSYSNSGNTVIFTNQSTDYSTVEWNFGDGSTSSEASPIHTYSETGEYTVTLTIETENCGNDIVTQNISFTGISNITVPTTNNTKIYPNPTIDYITIEYNSPELSNTYIDLYNQFGKLVYNQRIKSTNTLNLSDFNNGIYYMVVRNAHTRTVKKLIKLSE